MACSWLSVNSAIRLRTQFGNTAPNRRRSARLGSPASVPAGPPQFPWIPPFVGAQTAASSPNYLSSFGRTLFRWGMPLFSAPAASDSSSTTISANFPAKILLFIQIVLEASGTSSNGKFGAKFKIFGNPFTSVPSSTSTGFVVPRPARNGDHTLQEDLVKGNSGW